MKLLWVVPEKKGGIRDYGERLLECVQRLAPPEIEVLKPCFSELQSNSDLRKFISEISALKNLKNVPDLIHVQHEFGLFNSKVPGFYRFPKWVRMLRAEFLNTRIVATGHTVLSHDTVLPWKGRGWQTGLRWIANKTILPSCRRLWTEGTWGLLDGVIVHSQLQAQTAIDSGCPNVEVIPHFVGRERPTPEGRVEPGTVLVFGYFSPEKGQDIAIRSFARVKHPGARLVFAGGVRRDVDQPYFEQCKKLAQDLGLESRVTWTGYLKAEEVNGWFDRAELVLAPFRETHGSGSLAQALARGKAILTSDLPLNREINDRVPGALALYRSENTIECSGAIERLLSQPAGRRQLGAAAQAYAEKFQTENIARAHFEFYKRIQHL